MRALKRLLAFALGLGLLWLARDRREHPRPRHQAEWLQAADVSLRTLRTGRGQPTLLLLHGYGESLMGFRAIMDRLASHHQVVAVDLPGFGVSDKPDLSYDLASYRRRLGDFLARWTAGPVVIIGHSMGGEIAAALALDHPDRIAGLVLIAPAGYGLSPLLSDSSGIASPAAAWVATALSLVIPVHDPAWLAEPEDRLSYQPGSDSAYRKAASRILRDFDFAALRDQYRALRTPTLLIWGREDPTIPVAVGEELATVLPCHHLEVLANTLHRPHQAKPDTVATLVERFVAEPGAVCQK